MSIMAIDKFYIIHNNIVQNIALFEEGHATSLGLKRAPILTDSGIVDINWTYLPNEDTFLPPPRDILNEWRLLRTQRNMLLATSDPFVTVDRWATYNQDEQYELSMYRKALRDVPQNTIDPRDVIWPKIPQIMLNVLEENKFKPSDPEV